MEGFLWVRCYKAKGNLKRVSNRIDKDERKKGTEKETKFLGGKNISLIFYF